MTKLLVDADISTIKKENCLPRWLAKLLIDCHAGHGEWFELISCLVTGSNRKQTQNNVNDSAALFMILTFPNWFPLMLNPGIVAIRVTAKTTPTEVPSSSAYSHMCCCAVVVILCVQLVYIV